IDNTKIDFSLQKEKRKMRKIHEKNTFIAVPPVLFGCLVRCKMDKGEFEEFSIRLDRRDNDAIHELVYFNVILEDISDDIWVEVHKATVGSNHELEYKFNVRNNLFRQGKYDQIPRIFVFVKKEQSTNVYVRRFIPKEIWKFYVRGYEKKDLMFFGSIGSEKDLDRYLTELGPEARVALEKEILSARVVIGQKFSKEIIKEYVQNTNPLSWSITDKIIAVREACKNRVYLKKSDELVELIHDPSGVNYFLQHAKLNPKGLFLKDPYCRNTGSDR
ncbi:MAG: hypothetical protein QGH40_04225, partial [bacterium]|nr:hypothetical protein [bacterium]